MANKKGIAAVSAAALVLAAPLVAKWEGTRTTPYRDIVGVWTVCTGETRVKMQRYSPAECAGMLNVALAEDYGPDVLRCTPGIADRPKVLAAAMSLTYNIGPSAYCRSTVARRFNAGNIRGGCDAFLAWNKAGGRVVRGLQRRREDERSLCLS